MPMPDSRPNSTEIPTRLTQLLSELYSETDGFLDRTGDAQLWYNRGYANGLASALQSLGHGSALAGAVTLDPPDISDAHAFMPWGKAYAHGFEMGRRETIEVMEPL
jgi:hypothetical protein